MEEDRTAVCQGWGCILLGAEVHSPNSWWGHNLCRGPGRLQISPPHVVSSLHGSMTVSWC